jgi:uncharacterized membrane protein YtjA (UPF0391 family)
MRPVFLHRRSHRGAVRFTGIAAAAASIAKILFFVFIAICVIFLIGLIAGRAIL